MFVHVGKLSVFINNTYFNLWKTLHSRSLIAIWLITLIRLSGEVLEWELWEAFLIMFLVFLVRRSSHSSFFLFSVYILYRSFLLLKVSILQFYFPVWLHLLNVCMFGHCLIRSFCTATEGCDAMCHQLTFLFTVWWFMVSVYIVLVLVCL